jgi:fibronectin type 3 domain-containing protein
MFTNVITVVSEGCVCFVLDDILPAEAGSFAAVPRDNSVELNWTTLSENGVNNFSVMRNNEKIATVNANNDINGSTYTYVDETAHNGVTYSYTLITNNMDNTISEWNVVEATPMSNLAVITEYALHQNFPNPFNPTTSIVFDVVEDNHVTLTVYNAMGQEVATLVNGMYGNGRHNVEFGSDNLTSGLYFYTVKIGNEFTATKKMLLVK